MLNERIASLCALSWLALSLLLNAPRARAEDVALDAFLPPPDQTGFTGFASTRTPGPWGIDTNLWLDYALRPVAGKPLGFGDKNPVNHRLESTLAVQMGILTRGALALRMPFAWVQRGDDLGSPKLATVAAGNPALDGRVRLLGAPVRPDGSVNDGGALALRGIVHVPVGTSHAYLADDAWRTELSAIADVQAFGLAAGLALGWRHRFDESKVANASFADQLRLGVGLRLPLPLLSRLYPGQLQERALVELDMGTSARDFFVKRVTPIEGRLSYRVIAGDYFVTLGVGVGTQDRVGSPVFRTLLALGWSPRKHDQDADGVPDSEDQCVHLPEDRDGFQDEDGCADDDNDGDMIVDEDDRCPLEAAEIGRDEDEDGCTDR